jgi:PAS domain S-box-containing protein
MARFGGWTVDLELNRCFWSDEVCAIHEMPEGYAPLVHEGINFYAPECRAKITDAFTKCATLGTPYDEELQIITSSGRRVWVRALGRAVSDASGKVVRVDGAFQDITERKQAELLLAESEARYRALFENMAAGFILFEVVRDTAGIPVDLVILAANAQCEVATGRDLAHMIGRRLTEAFPGIEADSAGWIKTYGQVALTGHVTHFEASSELLGRHYLVSAYRPAANQCAITFTDVTERKQAEIAVARLHEELRRHAARLEQRVEERTAELATAKAQAEASDRAKSAFLATMSHELRTPLNSIIGFTDIVISGIAGPVTDEQAKQLAIVQQSSRHLLSLISDMLDVAKIEAGQLRIVPECFDLRPLLERTGAVFEAEARRRNLAFDVQVRCAEAKILADKGRVEQVLNNLMSNALKFTHEGRISLLLERTDGRIVVSVTDTGIGIRAEDLGRLFRPFSQLESDPSRSYEGTGLGLAITRHLLSAMNGTIDLASEPGQGSRFTFTLPEAP